MINPIVHALLITVVDDADEAIAKGFDYNKGPNKAQAVALTDVVVVRRGTERGLSTVDFVLVDDTGQKYAFTMTGRMLKSIQTFPEGS